MPTAKKLPSGSWRVQVYSHHEGKKKIRHSFTAPTKREAELMASQFKNGLRSADDNKTVKEAIKGYIAAKKGVLSPSTIRGYERMAKYYAPIDHLKLSKLTNEKMQLFVSDLSGKLSPKTVSNIFGLLTSSIALYLPEKRFKVTLPRIIPKQQNSPSDDDIRALYEGATDRMKVCIALAAFGSMRRGEISALKYGDIKGNTLYIHSNMVKDPSGKWVVKEPKTPDSIRTISVPQAVIDLIGEGKKGDYIVKWTPDSITKRFIELRASHGLTIRFHDMRHYFASISAVLMPDIYTASLGGWKQNSKVLKSVYQNKIIPLAAAYNDKLIDHFDGILEKGSHEVHTKKKKAAK